VEDAGSEEPSHYTEENGPCACSQATLALANATPLNWVAPGQIQAIDFKNNIGRYLGGEKSGGNSQSSISRCRKLEFSYQFPSGSGWKARCHKKQKRAKERNP
jgi:hypothetical protein